MLVPLIGLKLFTYITLKLYFPSGQLEGSQNSFRNFKCLVILIKINYIIIKINVKIECLGRM